MNKQFSSQQSSTTAESQEFFSKVVNLNRCAKVVQGGRRFSFSAIVVVGNRNGLIGIGKGSANEVSDAVRKATDRARRNMRSVVLKGTTIPHLTMGKFDGGHVLLRPAAPGTGVIAGGGVRAVLEAAGIKDVLTKSLRSNNPIATVYATFHGLLNLRSSKEIKSMRFGSAHS